jgi:hypothetical protein
MVWFIIASLLLVLITLYFYSKKEGFENDDWKATARNINLYDNMIEAELQDNKGEWIYNRIEIHPALKGQTLVNIDGTLTYQIEDDSEIMNTLFPFYKGETIPSVSIDKCVMLSVNTPKYNKAREETLKVLGNYRVPPIEVHYGYTPETVETAPYYNRMKNPDSRNELALGMLDIFENFTKKYPKNGWLLYFEDDVRPINIIEADLATLHNVPIDAEMIRPYTGKHESIDMKNIQYRTSYGGGLNHAFYISSSGCQKVLRYVKNHKWQYVCDIDLYKLAKGCGEYPTALDGWSLRSTENKNDISSAVPEEDKIVMYHTSHILFDQTSNPLTPVYQK